MKHRFHVLALTLLISTSLSVQAKTELANLSVVKKDLENYHDSGAYNSDITHSVNQAMRYLHFRVHQNSRLEHPKKLAMVLDIDETSLSNYQDMLRLSFGGTSKEVDDAIEAGHDKAIKQTLALYTYAKKHQVAVFFITGRPIEDRENTIKNLTAVGFKDWDGLYLKPDNYAQKSVVPYKSGVRKEIIQKGYDIVLNVGDQESDLKGGSADMGFKLPNPYYFIR